MSSNGAGTPRRGPMGRGMAAGEKAKDFNQKIVLVFFEVISNALVGKNRAGDYPAPS